MKRPPVKTYYALLSTHRDACVTVALVLLAACLRLARLELIEFKTDEVMQLDMALQMAREGVFPLAGSFTSIWMPKGPLFTWLMALPVLFSRDPRVATGFIAALNALACGGLYLVGRRYYGRCASGLAGLLYAVNPWAVLYARKVFTDDVLAPFCLLLWWGLLRWLADERPGGLALALGSLGALLMITWSPWPLALLTFILLAANLRRVRWKHCALGAGVALALTAPWLIYQARGGFAGVVSLWVRVTSGAMDAGQEAGAAADWWRPLRNALWLHSGLNYASLAGPSAGLFRPWPAWLGWTRYLLAGLLGAGLIQAAWRGIRSLRRGTDAREAAAWRVHALWVWLPLLGFALQPGELYLHYLVVLFPAGAMALGLAGERCARLALGACRGPARRAAAVLLAALLAAVVFYQAGSFIYLLGFVTRHETHYGVPLAWWRQVTAAVADEARAAGTDELWVVAEGGDPAMHTEPSVLSYLLAGRLELVFLGAGGQEGLPLPVERAGVYLVTRASPPVEAALAELGAAQQAAFTQPGGARQARLLTAQPRPLETLFSALAQPGLPLINYDGPALLGYAWQGPAAAGGRVALAALWELQLDPAAAPGQRSFSLQVYDSSGRIIAQDDGYALAERSWRRGRYLLQWFALDLPAGLDAGEYQAALACYRLEDGARSGWRDAAGAFAGGEARLEPLVIR